MKKYTEILKKTQLFAGVSAEEITSMLVCLDAKCRKFKKGEYVISVGEKIDGIAILVEGQLHIQNDDYWGNRSIISSVSEGEIFGEAYAMGGVMRSDVVSLRDSVVIFFDVHKVLHTCSSGCAFHTRIVQNLFAAISEKNRRLVQKLAHMSGRTTRDKLISYLSEEARRKGSASFAVPFNRQQLADFLSVDRSAMSKELCRMRDEGLLSFDKNSFTLYEKED